MFRRLLYLNGLSIISVVLFHSAGMGFVAMFAWAERYLPPGVSPSAQIGTLEYYLLRFFEQIAIFCIPAFIFISGYFITVATSRTKSTIEWSVVFSRIRTLVIPYLLWTSVVLVLQVTLEGTRLTPTKLIVDLLTGGTNEVLYFVPLLIQFYLLAPFFVRAARRNWKLLLAVTGIIQLIPILLPYLLLFNQNIPFAVEIVRVIPKWLFVSRIFWFAFGIVFGFQLEYFKNLFFRYRWALLAIAALCIPLGIIEWEILFRSSGLAWLPHRETITDTIYSLAMTLGILMLTDVTFPFTAGVERLGKESYGIYLTHFIFIEYTAKMIYRFFPQLLGHQFLLQPILILVGLGIPIAMMYLLDHSPGRKSYAYVFG